MLGTGVDVLRAQCTGPYVFNVFVDPIHGDDQAACLLNPPVPNSQLAPAYNNNPAIVPGGFHFDPANINGNLVYAPYPFRTLNGAPGGLHPGGAIPWINATFLGDLPFTFGGENMQIGWIVIHLLPGLYGPTTNRDQNSGLRWNDDVFPVVLRHRVSLQGVSALDTILDARGGNPGSTTGLLEAVTQGSSRDFQETYVDGLTLRGARVDPERCTTPNSSGSALFIAGEAPCHLLISNCFIYDNDVGVAISSDEDPQWAHVPSIVNNTFARNTQFSIWNGNMNPLQVQRNNGLPMVLNNIFDSTTPPFAGIDPNDLRLIEVLSAGSWLTLPQPYDTNAYILMPGGQAVLAFQAGFCQYLPTLLANRRDAVAGEIQSDLGTDFVPNVDLAPYVGVGSPRGILFVNDLLQAASSTLGESIHDYRLSPHSTTDRTAARPFPVNALVNRGFAPSATYTSARFGNTREVGPLGIRPCAPTNQFIVTYNPFDHDCEGYGNPRIVDRSGFPPGPYGFIDLGADEMGEVILTGYLDDTRMFSSAHACAPTLPDRRRAYLLNLSRTVSGSPIQYWRPVFNQFEGADYAWYAHKELPNALPPGCSSVTDPNLRPSDLDPLRYATGGSTWINLPSNYTWGKRDSAGIGQSNRYAFGSGPSMNVAPRHPVFPRSLYCDFGASLLGDIYPLWADAFTSLAPPPMQAQPPVLSDIYGVNPWYSMDASLYGDNLWMFQNPLASSPPSPSQSWMAVAPPLVLWPQVDSGIVHPPGTYYAIPAPPPNSNLTQTYLMPGIPPGLWTSWGGCTTSPFYLVDDWGVGPNGAGCPDIVASATPFRGIRYNLENFFGLQDPVSGMVLPVNIQTTLVVTVPMGESMNSEFNQLRGGPGSLPKSVAPPDMARLIPLLMEAARSARGQR